jgi:hypothetical protein
MRRDAVSVFRRILPLAAAVSRGVRTLGVVGLGAAVAIALVVLVRWTPGDRGDWAGLVVLCVLLVVPPAVLLALSLVIGQVVELPAQGARIPGHDTRARRGAPRDRARRAGA